MRRLRAFFLREGREIIRPGLALLAAADLLALAIHAAGGF